MKRFVEREHRTQITLLPECLDDYVAEDNPVRVVGRDARGAVISHHAARWMRDLRWAISCRYSSKITHFATRALTQGETTMAISMYQISVPIFVRHLSGLVGCLRKAQAVYAEKKNDESSLLGYRLYPDMFSFTRQVQVATDHARNCAALLAGLEAPKYEDNEKSLAELIARVEKTMAYLNTIEPEQLDGSEEKTVTVKLRDREMNFAGLDLLLNRSMPNFYFHTTTAYDIIRHNGVEIGKRDFMGAS